MGNYYGIDFGTTNSAVIAIQELNGIRIGEKQKIGEDQNNPLPSFVAINKKTNEVVTGLEAKNAISNSEEYQIFSSIKTVIDEDKVWTINERKWTPIDIAAELFRALIASARKKQNGALEISEAVVAVPVGYSAKKKNSIRKAAAKAGLTITSFISEPTAAYCSRREELKMFKNVAVFDWGGGTLDVVVLQIEDGIVKELAAEGMTLAGNDIDKKIAEKICLKISRKTGQKFTFDDLSSEYKLRLLTQCESAKCDFSEEEEASIVIMKLDKYGRVNEEISYDYFSLIIEQEIDKAISCLLKALSEAGMNQESIDCILCEGGSSRLRPLQEKLLEYFEREKLIFPNSAMWDIASGAAELSLKPGCYRLSKPIGILQANNLFYPLLKIGQRIPTEEKRVKFGIVESTDEARFVFTDGAIEETQTFTEYFPIKLRGFSDESLEVFCYVDADMVFRMKIHSDKMPDDVFRVWTYSNLKVAYELDAPSPQTRQLGGIRNGEK